MRGRRFVIVDRDGTLIVERHYLSDPAQVELLPGAAAGLRELQRLGFGCALITNQSAIGRGYFNLERLDAIHQRMHALLAVEEVRLDGVYYCPHVPEDHCACRKPNPGLIHIASKELGFDPAASFIIGDNTCDIELGRAVGATTLLVRTGYGAEVANDPSVTPHHVVDDLAHAARLIAGMATATGSSGALQHA